MKRNVFESLKRIHNLLCSESLEKAHMKNGVWMPDTDGESHPERKDLVQGRMLDGSHSWFPKVHLQVQRDKDFESLAVRNFSKFKPVQKLYLDMAQKVMKDPERHAVKGGTGGSKDLRLRHLSSALSGSDGYSITHDGSKIKIVAERHSTNTKHKSELHTWEYSDNGLKFLGITPKR